MLPEWEWGTWGLLASPDTLVSWERIINRITAQVVFMHVTMYIRSRMHIMPSCALHDTVQIDTHHTQVCHYTCTCVRMYVRVYVCMYVYTYVCTCVRMYVRVHYCQQDLPPPSGRPPWPPARHSGRPACPHRPLPGGAAWSGTSGGALHGTCHT